MDGLGNDAASQGGIAGCAAPTPTRRAHPGVLGSVASYRTAAVQ